MDNTQLFQKAQQLSDLELSILVCLMGGESCIIEAPEELLDELAIELRLVCTIILKMKIQKADSLLRRRS